MLTHSAVWAALDGLAARHNLSASGLAKKAGLDPTSFNKSKRTAPDGRPRWPSTESLAKVLEATGESIDAFMGLISGSTAAQRPQQRLLPLIGFAQAGVGGFFDDGGFPVGTGWEEVEFLGFNDDKAYVIEVSGDSMYPLYRDGDRIVVSPSAPVRRGDRVVVHTKEGEVMVKEIRRQTAKTIELGSLNPAHPDRTLDLKDVERMHRVMWASQ